MLPHLLLAACITNAPPRDAYGDPLPPGAVARFGSLRYRCNGTSLTVSPDGKRVAVHESARSRIAIFDAADGRETGSIDNCSLQRVTWPGRLATFTADSKRLLVAFGHDMLTFDAATAALIKYIDMNPTIGPIVGRGDGGAVRVVAGPGPDKAVVVGWSGWGAVVDAAAGTMVAGFPIGSEHLCIAPDASTIAGKLGTGVTLFRSADGTVVWKAEAPQPVVGLAVGPTGVAATTADFWLLFDLATGELRRKVPLPPVPAGRNPVSFCPAGRTSFVTLPDGRVLRFDVATGEQLAPLTDSLQTAEAVTSPGGATIYTLGDTKSGFGYTRWDAATARPLPGQPVRVVPFWLDVSPDGRRVVADDMNGGVAVWDADGGNGRFLCRKPQTCYTHPKWVGPHEILIVRTDGYREYWDDRTGALRIQPHAGARPTEKNYCTNYAPIPGTNTAVEVWSGPRPEFRRVDVSTGRTAWSAPALQHIICSPDGRLLATREPNRIGIRSADTGRLVATVPRAKSDANGNPAAFSPDGTTLAAVEFGAVRFYDTASGEPLGVWERPLRPLPKGFNGRAAWSFAYASDGRYAALAGEFDTVEIFEVATRKEVLPLATGGMPALRPQFGPRGATLTAALWGTPGLTWDLRPPGPPPDDILGSLAGPDAAVAYRAVWHLADHFDRYADAVRKKLPPAAAGDPMPAVAQHIIALDSPKFADRDAAGKALLKLLGEFPSLREKYAAEAANTASAEVRAKLEGLLKAGPPAADLFRCRVLAAAERSDKPSAKKLLRDWAAGTPGASLTVEAKAALRRAGE